MRKFIPLAVAAALAGCGADGDGAPEGAAEAKPAPSTTPPASDGAWRRANREGASALVFANGRDRPLAALRCDQQIESLLIERMADKLAAGADSMKLRIAGRAQRLPIIWDGASPLVATATVKIEDPLTDSLSRIGGVFELELKGTPKLMLPADRRIGTLIEECRQI